VVVPNVWPKRVVRRVKSSRQVSKEGPQGSSTRGRPQRGFLRVGQQVGSPRWVPKGVRSWKKGGYPGSPASISHWGGNTGFTSKCGTAGVVTQGGPRMGFPKGGSHKGGQQGAKLVSPNRVLHGVAPRGFPYVD
jgi:hypothetical protein